MWRKLPDFRVEKKAQNPVTSLAVMVLLVPTESVSRVFPVLSPDFTPEALNRTRVTSNYVQPLQGPFWRGRWGSRDKGGYSRTKVQPKEEVFGTDFPRTSGGHSRGYPGPKLRSGPSKSWKNKHFAADIHDPKARTSTTLRGFQKLWSEKLWAEFSFPSYFG